MADSGWEIKIGETGDETKSALVGGAEWVNRRSHDSRKLEAREPRSGLTAEMKWKSLDHPLNRCRAGALGSDVSRVGIPEIEYGRVGDEKKDPCPGRDKKENISESRKRGKFRKSRHGIRIRLRRRCR